MNYIFRINSKAEHDAMDAKTISALMRAGNKAGLKGEEIKTIVKHEDYIEILVESRSRDEGEKNG